MKSRKMAKRWVAVFGALGILAVALVSLGAKKPAEIPDEVPDWMREITDHLIEIRPVLFELDRMQEVILAVKASSPTLELLDELSVKAESVDRMNSALERLAKVEPVLESLEAMQRDFAKRNRTQAGNLPRKMPSWSVIFEQLQSRLDSVEKSLYAPDVLRDPVASRRPIELRLGDLEERQKALLKEMESINRELRRLRRQQRESVL